MGKAAQSGRHGRVVIPVAQPDRLHLLLIPINQFVVLALEVRGGGGVVSVWFVLDTMSTRSNKFQLTYCVARRNNG